MTIDDSSITGQGEIDSYVSAHVELCLTLINDLAIAARQGRGAGGMGAAFTALAGSPWLRGYDLSSADVDLLAVVAGRLREAVDACLAGDLHAAAQVLNSVLADHGAVPNLHAEPHGLPRLAFHAATASIVDAWAAESAASLALLVDTRQTHRLGQCSADACDAYFLDATKNGSRRFCSLGCQNRAKSAAYRRRSKLS
ncbi:CGNR zinc finger domain-containing protein [Dactylosporangium fulvum]|uniref:CGNR zinc finger domain-containing protein n=1 Tax=Dactylosporangium fulvum TaxID=53359 RepID=A0ABY5VY23_9ACTN|nr:CGNR zinc finger domain-containing protein [Dactylosporangium fulvum]UWP81949.1 CGNR zinc finger domain-containing protein [Dactylosporangium fulvum]